MGSKKERIVISGNSRTEALKEAKMWALQLEKEVRGERRNCRTRGLILLGSALLGGISEKGLKVMLYVENAAKLSHPRGVLEPLART